MRRGRRIAAAIGTAVAVVAVGTGAAYGVLALTDITETIARADAPTQDDVRPEETEPTVDATPRPVADRPTIKPKPEPEPVLEPGDKGIKVRELQSRLDQIAWYLAPEITGVYDRHTTVAVRGFQKKRGFEVTGEVDPRTWKRVLSMTRMPTDDEMHNRMTPGPTILGPGDTGIEVRELQARLKQIGWFSPDVTNYYGDTTTASVEGFQAKREIPVTGEVDQRTMDRLLEMTSEPSDAELYNRTPAPAAGAPLDPRCLTGEVMCVDKSSNSLRWVVDGKVQLSLDVRFGSDELPTREGEFPVFYKSRDHVSSLYNTSMPLAMFFSGGQAVHYSPDFAANGYNGASHGCVNVRDYDAIAWLFEQVDIGDKVVVYWS